MKCLFSIDFVDFVNLLFLYKKAYNSAIMTFWFFLDKSKTTRLAYPTMPTIKKHI